MICPGLSVFVPIGFHASTACVVLTVNSGFILAFSPYRMFNAGLCNDKENKKKGIPEVACLQDG